jgi:hypothetical protein
LASNIVFWLQTLFFGLEHCFLAWNIVWPLGTLFQDAKQCFSALESVSSHETLKKAGGW